MERVFSQNLDLTKLVNANKSFVEEFWQIFNQKIIVGCVEKDGDVFMHDIDLLLALTKSKKQVLNRVLQKTFAVDKKFDN